MIIESVLSIVSGATGVYSAIGALKSGRQAALILEHLASVGQKVERLSDRILYFERTVVRNTERARCGMACEISDIKNRLEPVAEALGQEILSSSLIPTPYKMKAAMASNPWNVLLDIRPLSYAVPQPSPEMVPILFSDSGTDYIGWQLAGVMQQLFDCIYEPSQWLQERTPGHDVQPPDRPFIQVQGYEWFRGVSPAVKQVSEEIFRLDNAHVYVIDGKVDSLESIDLYFSLIPDPSSLVVVSTGYSQGVLQHADEQVIAGRSVSLLLTSKTRLLEICDLFNKLQLGECPLIYRKSSDRSFDPVLWGLRTAVPKTP